MIIKRRSVPILVSVALFALMSALGAFGADYPLTITDSAGRNITFEAPVERVIVLNSDAAEAMVMLGAADKVVGISDTVSKKGYYFPDLKKRQSLGKWNSPDYEMIGEIAKGGQESITSNIIVVSYSYPDKPYGIFGVEKGLAPFKNIKCVALDFYRPENMTREIEILGKIIDKEDSAKDYVDWYNEKISQINAAVEGENKPKVYAEWSSSGDLVTFGPGSGFDLVMRAANGFNIGKSLKDANPKVDWEWVVSQGPEIIIKRQTQSSDQNQIGWQEGPSSDTVMLEGVRNDILSRPGASGIPAVKSNKVYIMDWDVMNGLDQVVGITYVAKLLHPGADLDPVAVHKEFLARLGLDYPEGRTFVYPELEEK